MKPCSKCSGKGKVTLLKATYGDEFDGFTTIPCETCCGEGMLPNLRSGFLGLRQYVDCPSCGKANLYIGYQRVAETKSKYCTCGTYLWV